ncbi:hypothetical protein V3C99_018005 [Haemonchus contortus]|uniref:Reverse transcriptase domain-containing protein n=1 Tax=Haemonchus contortus TaxID=6289 RepID=A0A7I4Z3Z8_HAECO
MLQLDWDDKGINIDGRKLANLRFADDIVLISQNREELQQMVEELDDVSKAIGLTMNMSKTTVMRNEWADASPITLEGTTLPFTDSYVYLCRDYEAQKMRVGGNRKHKRSGSSRIGQESTS